MVVLNTNVASIEKEDILNKEQDLDALKKEEYEKVVEKNKVELELLKNLIIQNEQVA